MVLDTVCMARSMLRWACKLTKVRNEYIGGYLHGCSDKREYKGMPFAMI